MTQYKNTAGFKVGDIVTPYYNRHDPYRPLYKIIKLKPWHDSGIDNPDYKGMWDLQVELCTKAIDELGRHYTDSISGAHYVKDGMMIRYHGELPIIKVDKSDIRYIKSDKKLYIEYLENKLRENNIEF